MTARAAALKRLADVEQPLYQSLDEAQKRRFGMAFRSPLIGAHQRLTSTAEARLGPGREAKRFPSAKESTIGVIYASAPRATLNTGRRRPQV